MIGIDDWAKRRGQNYGTVVVDLERHQALDLLEDRTAETWADWLQWHPTVEVIARDRSSEYARSSDLGTPQSQRVADRWHRLVSLRGAFERLLDRLRPEPSSGLQGPLSEKQLETLVLRTRHHSHAELVARKERLFHRLAVQEKVQRLH